MGGSSPNSAFFFYIFFCLVFFVFFVVVHVSKKKLERGVGGRGLAYPPSRIILYPLLRHHMRHSHNLPLPPRIYPLSNIYMRLWPGTLPESTPLSQNIPGTPLSNIYTRASQNLLLPPRIYTPSLFIQCDSHRIYPSLLPG